mmetsp:Transcript_30462/g.94561  ORF Transcript_30462/g.94561 Transcript_30462/m.94561 type:complete len:320 (-) Transcript_30462:3613-4572(-)
MPPEALPRSATTNPHVLERPGRHLARSVVLLDDLDAFLHNHQLALRRHREEQGGRLANLEDVRRVGVAPVVMAAVSRVEVQAEHLRARPPRVCRDVRAPERVVLAATGIPEGEQRHVALPTVNPNVGIEGEAVGEIRGSKLLKPKGLHVEVGEVGARHEVSLGVEPLGGARARTRTPVAADTLALLEDAAEEAAHGLGRGHVGVAGVGVVVVALPDACHSLGAGHHALRTHLHLGQDAATAGGLAHTLLELRIPDAHRAEGRQRGFQRRAVLQDFATLGRRLCGEHREVAEAHGVARGGLRVQALLLRRNDPLRDAEQR